jgi:ketosteroid isomerase-like protein
MDSRWQVSAVSGVVVAAVVVGILVGGVIVRGEELADEELSSVETAFAATMANRDAEAFRSFLDEEVVFFLGSTELRGAPAVVEVWAAFFEGEKAPFSWRPEVAAVLDSGALGLTSGPVLDPEGNRVGTFNSIWRRDSEGRWKIVFDRGCP